MNNKNRTMNIKNKKQMTNKEKVLNRQKKNSKQCYKPKMKHGDVKHEQT